MKSRYSRRFRHKEGDKLQYEDGDDSMKLFISLVVAVAAFAADGKPTDADKLKVREIQLASRAAFIRLKEVEANPYYRKALGDAEEAQKAEEAALAELGKRLSCTIDPQTVACQPKPADAK